MNENQSISVGTTRRLRELCQYFTEPAETEFKWIRTYANKSYREDVNKSFLFTEEYDAEQKVTVGLTIVNASKDHEGWYTCQAKNPVGSNEECRIYITVTEMATATTNPNVPGNVPFELGIR